MNDDWNAAGSDWKTDWNADTSTNTGDWNGNQNGNQNDNQNGATDFDGGFDSGTVNDAEAAGGNNGSGGACRNCGQEGHFARECTEPRKLGPCFNCGEEGHSKAECTKPRVFKGTCNICQEEGHPAAQCPSKPKMCNRCKEEGDHDTAECTNNFYINLDDVETMTENEAWSKVIETSRTGDIDEFKEALRMLQKAAPEITYPAIEKKLRADKLNMYLIALKKDVGEGYTLVNLQGESEMAHLVAIFKSPNCQRPNLVDKWPGSVGENLERLANAGVAFEKGIPYCRNCSQFGHTRRSCEQDKNDFEGPSIVCALCSEAGHRVRDCTQERKKARDPMKCRICEGEHMAKDCDQKRPPMTCRNCDQEGHKAADCDQPRKIKCNNCDAEDHMKRDCPHPVDWSRVTCRFCGEKGHASASRCAPGAAKKQDENETHDSETNHQDDTATNFTTDGGDWNGASNYQQVTSTDGW